MRPHQLIKEIDKLNLSEKIELVENIWESIARSNSELPLPEWQKNELSKRYGEYTAGKLAVHDVEQVHSDIRAKGR